MIQTSPRAHGSARQNRRTAALCLALSVAAQGCFKKEPAREAPATTSAPAAPAKEEKAQPEAESQQAAPPAEAAGGAALPAPAAPPPPQPAPSLGSAPRPAAKASSRGGGAPQRSTLREEKGRAEPEKDDSASTGALMDRLGEEIKATAPDCPSARERRKAICDLAGQICQLTDKDPNVASVEQYCEDARRRCSEAGRKTEQRCSG